MNPYTVMIVEDEKIMREDLLSIVDWRAEGFKIIGVAVNGKQGLTMFEELRPQIVISDIRMPVINGITMVKSIRAISSHARILILSAFGEFEYAKEAITVGADDYILKAELSANLMKQKLALLSEKLKKSQLSAIERAKGRLRELIDRPEGVECLAVELACIEEIVKDCCPEMLCRLFLPYIERSFSKAFDITGISDQYKPFYGKPDDCFQWFAVQLNILKAINEGIHQQKYSAATINAIEYINQNFANNNLKSEDVAHHVYLSKGRLGVLFKQETGKTLNEYLTQVRVEAAKTLILSGKYKVYEVAELVGYQTSQYFSQVFLQLTGKSPNKYRREG